MNDTALDYLCFAQRDLDPQLISAEVIGEIQRIARLFPPVMGIDLECRLADEAPRADYLMRVLRTDPCREALLGRGAAQLPEALLSHPVWQSLVALSRAWDDQEGKLHGRINDLFLEFDMVERTQAEVPVPCCFLDFIGEERSRLEQLDVAIPILHGAARWAAIRGDVERCLCLLPVGAYVYSVGWMLPRGMEGLRLCASGTNLDGWLDYLDRIGWPGSRAGLEASVRELAGLADRVDLDLDVGPGVGPKVGIELQIDAGLWKSKERWTTLLDWLVEHGCCLPSKRDSALSWMGYAHEREQPEGWPAGLQARSEALGAQALSVFTRRIGHVKMTCVPGRPLEAKVYLEFMHYWLRYSESKRRYVMDERDPQMWSE